MVHVRANTIVCPRQQGKLHGKECPDKKHAQAWTSSTRSHIFACIWVRTGGTSPYHISHPCSVYLVQCSSSLPT